MKSDIARIHCIHIHQGREIVDDRIYIVCEDCKMTLQIIKLEDLDSFNDLQESIEIDRARDN